MREKESWKERRKRTIYLDEKKTRRRKENEIIFQKRKRPESYFIEGERIFLDEKKRYVGGLHGRMGRKPIPHGYGTMYNQHGVKIYQGDYRMGDKHGDGCTFHRSGAPFQEGTFVDDLIVSGITYRSDCTIEYKGDYKEGVPHGVGKYIFAGGKSFYEGSFNNGLFEGPGVEKRMRGKLDYVIEGVWNNGKIEDKDEDYLGKRIHSDWDHIIDPENDVNMKEFWPESDNECASVIQDRWKDYFYNNFLLKIRTIQKCWRNYLRKNPTVTVHTTTKDKTLWEVAVHAMKEEQSRLKNSRRLEALKKQLLPVDQIAREIRKRHFLKLKAIMLPATHLNNKTVNKTMSSEDTLSALINIAAEESTDDEEVEPTAESTNAMDALLGLVGSDEENEVIEQTEDSKKAMALLLGEEINSTDIEEEEEEEEEIIEETEDSKNAMAALLS